MIGFNVEFDWLRVQCLRSDWSKRDGFFELTVKLKQCKHVQLFITEERSFILSTSTVSHTVWTFN